MIETPNSDQSLDQPSPQDQSSPAVSSPSSIVSDSISPLSVTSPANQQLPLEVKPSVAQPLTAKEDFGWLYGGVSFKKFRRFGKPEPRLVSVDTGHTCLTIRDPKDKKDKGSSFLWSEIEQLSYTLLKTKPPKGVDPSIFFSIRTGTKLYEFESDTVDLRNRWISAICKISGLTCTF
jgi:hypothetical protein